MAVVGTEPYSNNTLPWRTSILAFIFRVASSKYLSKYFQATRGVVFVSPQLCIKSKPDTSLAEAAAMEFVRRNTSIPVPKVYSAFEHNGRVHIVMQKIRGTSVAYTWHSRDEQSQQRILDQLREMIGQLRNIPAPSGTGVSNTNHGPIFDPRLPRESRWGPFHSVREFHTALVDGHDLAGLADPAFPDLLDLTSFHNQPWSQVVFTHGDLSSLNIICRGDEVVGIVDWETAGWFPSYWEYVSAWNVNPRNYFWQDEVDKFLEPFPRALKMDAIRRKYYGDF